MTPGFVFCITLAMALLWIAAACVCAITSDENSRPSFQLVAIGCLTITIAGLVIWGVI